MLGKLFGRGRNKVLRLCFDQGWDSEFSFFNAHFQRFLDLQHLLLTHGEKKVQFFHEQEMLRYLYFIIGAADRLSRGIDSDRAQVWWGAIGLAQGTVLLKDKATAFEELKRYGDESNIELYDAGKAGWEAMGHYVKGAVPDASPEATEAFTYSGAMMTKVVRGY